MVARGKGENVVSVIYNQFLLHWQDQNGNTAVSFVTSKDQTAAPPGAATTLVAAAQPCCDARIVAVQFQSTLVIGGAATTGPYKTVWDRAVLIGRNSVTNKSQRQVLVGPKPSIFLPGNIIVDLTNPQVMAFQAAVQAVCGDSAGNACGPFQRGNRREANRS